MFIFMNESKTAPYGLFIARVALGGMMLVHGIPKLMNFHQYASSFPAFIGSPEISLCLAIFAEVFCSIAIIVGFLPRLASVPGFITMIVAVFLVHGQDAWAKKELGVLYGILYLTIMSCGGGKFCLKQD